MPPPPEGPLVVDGIRIGDTREDVEARLGAHPQPVEYFELSNCTGWRTPGGSYFFGNHPEEATPKNALVDATKRNGFAYGDSSAHSLPLVGYTPAGKVDWICGSKLTLLGRELTGSALLLNKSRAEEDARPAYCMAGPFAWRYREGQVSVSSPGECPGGPWTVTLFAAAPFTEKLWRDKQAYDKAVEEMLRNK